MNTEIIAIIDASGSMFALRTETIASFNKFVVEQQEQPGDARLKIVTFNTTVHEASRSVPIRQSLGLDLLNYQCQGFTALYDAIGQTLEQEGKRIREEQWAREVIVVIVTDGEENSSRMYSRERVKQMIEHAQQYGWKVLFLGANIDAFQAGESIGIALASVGQYVASPIGTQILYNSVSTTVSQLRAGKVDAKLVIPPADTTSTGTTATK